MPLSQYANFHVNFALAGAVVKLVAVAAVFAAAGLSAAMFFNGFSTQNPGLSVLGLLGGSATYIGARHVLR